MDKPKIVFFDVDGTLMSLGSGKMTDNTVRMLKQLQAQGIKVCICSGRAPFQMPDFPGGSFDAYVTFTGSYCFAPDTVIYSGPFSKKDVQQIVRNAKEIGRPVVAANDKTLSPNGVDDNLRVYYGFADLELQVDPDFEQFVQGDVYQIMVGCTAPEREPIVKDTDNAKVVYWWDRAVDVMPATADKGKGIERVLEYFGLDKSQAMVFGDGDNDLEAFRTLENCVAMGNGSDNLKRLAKAVCGSVDEDGIYHFMVEQGFIEG